MSVCSCISVMKAIIAHPLRQTRHWNTGSADCEHHQQFDTGYHRKSSSRTCMIWPECGVISCIHDNIHRDRRHAGNHRIKRTWRHLSIRPFPVKPLLFAQHIIQLRAPFLQSHENTQDSTLLTTITEWLLYHIHNEQTKKSRIMNSHTTTAFIEHMKPMKSINKQHIHHTEKPHDIRSPWTNSHEQAKQNLFRIILAVIIILKDNTRNNSQIINQHSHTNASISNAPSETHHNNNPSTHKQHPWNPIIINSTPNKTKR